MPSSWTAQQILSLAPDDSSRKNGQLLASARRWNNLGQSDTAIWGELAGSGASPYLTQVELSEPAFKCTCPSRKFPCKHALGLFLLYAAQPGSFRQDEPPGWVTEWLKRRANKEKPKSSTQEKPPRTTSPAALERRAAEREKRMLAGLEDLERWITDLLRQGLASAQSLPRSTWETTASRLVDAQIPGLSRMLLSTADQISSGDGWESRVLDQLSRIHMVLQGYRRIDSLSPETQADLRSLVGIVTRQDDLPVDGTVNDVWLIVSQTTNEENRLFVQRTWLWGQNSNRPALILAFAPPGQPLPPTPPPGMVLQGDLIYYPSAYPLRAVMREPIFSRKQPAKISGYANFDTAISAYAQALSQIPWLERFPMLLSDVIPLTSQGQWMLCDNYQRILPCTTSDFCGYTLLAVSGGKPIQVFGEWDGRNFMPLSVQTNYGLHVLSTINPIQEVAA